MDRSSFGFRHPQHVTVGPLVGMDRLIDVGRMDVEPDARRRQELRPARRGRGEDEASGVTYQLQFSLGD